MHFPLDQLENLRDRRCMKEMHSLALVGLYVGGGFFCWFVVCSDLLFGV